MKASQTHRRRQRLVAPSRTRPRRGRGFTLAEILVTVAIVGVVVVALYAAINTNIFLIRVCRENGMATQILAERLDTIRLYTWDQVNSNGFIPSSFTVGIDPADTNSTAYYTGTVSIAQAPISEAYSNELRLITVRLDWVAGGRPCSSSMSSFVTKYGLQAYIY